MNCRCASTVLAMPLKLLGLRQSMLSIEDIRCTSLAKNLSIIALTMSDGTWELPVKMNESGKFLLIVNMLIVTPSKAEKLVNKSRGVKTHATGGKTTT